MQLLFRLPLLLLEGLLRRGVDALATLTSLLRGADDESYAAPVSAEPFAAEPVARPPMDAGEALRRRADREQAAPPPPTPPSTAEEPLLDGAGPAGSGGHIEVEDDLVASSGPARDVGATITIQQPWEGYDGMPAAAVVARLRGADEATRAMVALYEQAHRARATVLRAAS
jgi:hypothetical protein